VTAQRIFELLNDELRECVWPKGQVEPVSEHAAATYVLLSLALDRAGERASSEEWEERMGDYL